MSTDSDQRQSSGEGDCAEPMPAALAPAWYAHALAWPRATEDAIVRGRWPRGEGSLKSGWRRGLAIYAAARECDVVAVVLKEPGTTTFLLLEALLRRGRPRAVVLHFLPRELPARRGRRILYRVWRATVERFAYRCGMRAGQAVTSHEVDLYRDAFGLTSDQLRFVPWAYSREAVETEVGVPVASNRSVFCSGRARTDWETLFAAATGADWQATAVCGKPDLERVRSLATASGAAVYCELSRAEHDRLLRKSSVYVLPLESDGPSAGHLRVMAAADAGVAVVTTDVPGIADYVIDGETAVLVPPHDHLALRNAVSALLDNPAEQLRLARGARERSRSRTYADYFAEIDSLLRG